MIIKIKVMTLTKKIASQLVKQGSVSETEFDVLMKNPSKIIGWIWSEDASWTCGKSKSLLVHYGETEYKLVPFYDNFLMLNPKQIFLT